MPVIKLYNVDLENLTGVNIERIKERLPLLCADVERIESDSLDVEFFPNRPDLFSVEGVARTMKQFLDIKPGLTTYNVAKSGIEMVVEPSVLDVRPYIVCGVVRNLHFDSSTIESLMLLQEHLHRGIGRNRDLEKVKPPFRYLAVDPRFSFVPLDYEEEMSMAEILERHPKGVAYKYILEDKTNYPLILDSSGGVISFPPIINAERTRVTESTTDIFLDVTGLDDNVSVALNIIACALAERGGQLQSVVLRYPDAEMETPSLAPKRMQTSVADVNSLIGLELSAEDCKKCCERMGLSAELKPDGRLDVIIPAYRSDILHPWDIIEDIAIGYGYNRIKSDIPSTMVIGEVHPIEDKKRQVREIMTGLGYFEVLTFTLTSERKQFELMRRNRHEEEEVQVASPISTEHTMLRSTIMPNLLEILALNQHRDLPQRIFEVGPVVLNIKEKYRLAAVSTHANANFAEVKSVVDSVLKEMCMDEVELSESEDGAFLAGRRADIKVEDERIGVFGELHPAVILNFGLVHPVVGFEVAV
jgi:phenylalanyl-tRNA synthetase beta chain